MRTLMFAAMTLSPVYLWASGLPQLSHMVAAVAIGLRVIQRPRIYWERWWGLGLVFVMYAYVVALVVFVIYGDVATLLAPTYYAFGFLVFVLLVSLCRESKVFLLKVFWIHLFALVGLTTISVLGIGAEFGGRAMGTFNDPNQMGNWVLWTSIIIAVTGKALYSSWLLGLFGLLLSSLGVAFTASRSAGIGLFALFAVYLLMGVHAAFRHSWKARQLRVAAYVTLGLLLLATVLWGLSGTEGGGITHRILNQIDLWFARFGERDLDDSFAGRGYDRLWLFPEYLVFGAGAGAHARYAGRTRFLGEIHSSWAGLLFNYGIVGFVLFFTFVRGLLRKIGDIWVKLMLLGPFMYGFATYGIRNWYFWVGLALVYASWQVLPGTQIKGRMGTR